MVFVVVVVVSLVNGNALFIQHPLVLITFGTWICFLGVLLVAQPRTYVEYLCCHRMLRLAEKGRDFDETRLRNYQRRDAIVTVFGGVFALVVGLAFLAGGIGGLWGL